MQPSILLLSGAAVLFDTVSAHGFVKSLTIKGTNTPGADPVWYYLPAAQRAQTAGWNALNQDLGFVEPNNVGTSDVNCHKGATAGRLYASAMPGDTIQFNWNTWPDSHKGPIINYIAPCNGDCTTLTPTSLRWSKFSQSAIVSPGTWATDTMIKNNFQVSTVLPAKLAPGNYVVRHEIIALHSAGALNGAQSYPQCLNIEVTGSGTEKPDGVVGTSLYKADEDGIIFNINNGVTAYPIPGPALWTGGSGSGTPPASAPSATTATGTTQPTTTAAAVTTTAAATTTSAAAATSAVDESTPVASSTPVPSSGAELPETFTLDTFIAWLQKNAGSSSSSKARRHARALF